MKSNGQGLLPILASAALSWLPACGNTQAEPTLDEVQFIGRTDRREPGAVRMSWSGNGLVFRFFGTHAAVHLDDTAVFFSLLVDGKLQPRFETKPGARWYALATDLDPGIHEIHLYRRTEPLLGLTRVLGIDVGPSGQLLELPAIERRLEIIGDSISCGFGNEGADEWCAFSPETENHYISYGAITGRNLGAAVDTIAVSGRGVVYNYGGNTVDPMPVLYERSLAFDETSRWHFSPSAVDAVIINLGTNDFTIQPNPSEAIFGGAYEALLKRVRANYPQAFILCLTPTLLAGEEQAEAGAYVQRAVDEFRAAGDTRIKAHTLKFVSTGWGCARHPSRATHAAMAEALTIELKALLGW